MAEQKQTNPPSAKNRSDELRECRTTIGRIDTILADTRKYGFTLVTILLTADALLVQGNQVVSRVASSIVVMALVLILYLLDRYWYVLLQAAVSRALALEIGVWGEDAITQLLSRYSTGAHLTFIASASYGLFVVMGGIIAIAAVVAANRLSPGVWVAVTIELIAMIMAVVAIVWVHIQFQRDLDELRSHS